ncbi:MAG: DNA polymerase III subunit beta [Pseudomonadota bacterium]
MKFSINRTDLLRSLNHVHSVVERRNTIPILSNVLISAADNALALTTTDMDLEVVESVAAEVEEPGATTVPAHTLYDIVRKLPDDAVIVLTLPPGETTMTVSSGNSNFRLGCLPVEDFPKVNANDDMPYNFSIPAADLRTLIDRTRFAISNEETRHYLNGIYLHAADSDGVKVLRAVATDGHRLARFEMPLPAEAEGMPGVIIPRKTIAEIRKLAEEAADAIQLGLSETKLKISFDHIILTSKLIDGTFPDYQRVIPQGNNRILEVNPALLSRAVDRVSTVSTEKTRAIKMALNGKNLILSANSPESGSATEELVVNYDSDPMEIGFNSAYLIDVARQLSGEGCRIYLSDGASPTIIQDAEDTSSLYVLMPMRV